MDAGVRAKQEPEPRKSEATMYRDVMYVVCAGRTQTTISMEGLSGFLFQTNTEYLRPGRQYFLIISTLSRVLASLFIDIIDMF